MTPRLVFLLCVFLGLALWAESQEMPEACWRRGALRHAVVGVSVKRVSDGKDVCAFHAETALRPASVAKLIPAALALKAKGPSFAYVTRVGLTGEVRDGVLRGDLLVRAGGDPALDSRYFPSAAFLQRVVDTLAALGVREIEGRVRVEETSCDAAIPGSWLWEDVANYYGALCHGFNYRDNLYTLTFRSGEVGDTARLVGVEPSLPGVRFETRVTASSRNADNVWIYGGPDASVLRVRGTMPARRKAFAVKGAIHHPARVFESELTRRLAGNGIAVRNGIPENTSGARLLLEHRSPALAEIVRFTNKRSVNLFAEALGRLVASEDWEREAKRVQCAARCRIDRFARVGCPPSRRGVSRLSSHLRRRRRPASLRLRRGIAPQLACKDRLYGGHPLPRRLSDRRKRRHLRFRRHREQLRLLPVRGAGGHPGFPGLGVSQLVTAQSATGPL